MSKVQVIESKISNSSFDKTPIIIISGPTGTGKSSLAISLAKRTAKLVFLRYHLFNSLITLLISIFLVQTLLNITLSQNKVVWIT